MPADGETNPLVVAGLRVLGVLVASMVIAVGLFGESFTYGLALGVVLGVGFAAVAHVSESLSG